MTDTAKVRCPNCGIDMNRHAEKVDYSVEPGSTHAEFGGVVHEVHCCPGCGKTATRIAG